MASGELLGQNQRSGVFLLYALPDWVSMDVLPYESLARLLDEHGARLTLYAQLWCEIPDDVVQEAFVRMLAARAVFHELLRGP